jgi:hypothetical protein
MNGSSSPVCFNSASARPSNTANPTNEPTKGGPGAQARPRGRPPARPRSQASPLRTRSIPPVGAAGRGASGGMRQLDGGSALGSGRRGLVPVARGGLAAEQLLLPVRASRSSAHSRTGSKTPTSRACALPPPWPGCPRRSRMSAASPGPTWRHCSSGPATRRSPGKSRQASDRNRGTPADCKRRVGRTGGPWGKALAVQGREGVAGGAARKGRGFQGRFCRTSV